MIYYYEPWVEASAGGLLVPEGLYSPVAMYYVTSLKYGYVLNCSGKIGNSYQNSGLSPSGIFWHIFFQNVTKCQNYDLFALEKNGCWPN